MLDHGTNPSQTNELIVKALGSLFGNDEMGRQFRIFPARIMITVTTDLPGRKLCHLMNSTLSKIYCPNCKRAFCLHKTSNRRAVGITRHSRSSQYPQAKTS
ncbi:hypothetical protein PSTT_15739 [Puccinia striiformis]|uniref:Uncharacterized protein n=1 Tax=Puccinia striiformis TaxID=27350 RepID=A0A2S4UG64_9BASI|nr:hypothetical protein PSTT_15739 [Puccinia striiformis]